MSDEPALIANGIHKSFGSLEVLKGIDLNVVKGTAVSIIGPSGSGKSTLLRCLNLLETPEQGRISASGISLSFEGRRSRLSEKKRAAFRSRVGMVFQHFNLFPHRTVLGNVIEGPVIVLGKPKEEARKQGLALLEKVGLSDKADAYPSRLSGGQQQRVAIARALAMEPEIVLFDEITSALDPELVGDVLATVRQLADEGNTMILVTHEIAFAHEISDTVVFMRDGVIVEQGPPSKVLENPGDPRTQAFLARFHKFIGSFGNAD